MTRFICNNNQDFLKTLKRNIIASKEINIATCYITVSGLDLIVDALYHVDKVRIIVGYKDDGFLGVIRVLMGDDLDTLTKQKIYDLYKKGILNIVLAEKKYSLFHAKGYIFKMKDNKSGYVLVGSNNLTASGLKYNQEWSLETDDFNAFYYAYDNFILEWQYITQDLNIVSDGDYAGKIYKATDLGEQGFELIYILNVQEKIILICEKYKNTSYEKTCMQLDVPLDYYITKQEVLNAMIGKPLTIRTKKLRTKIKITDVFLVDNNLSYD